MFFNFKHKFMMNLSIHWIFLKKIIISMYVSLSFSKIYCVFFISGSRSIIHKRAGNYDMGHFLFRTLVQKSGKERVIDPCRRIVLYPSLVIAPKQSLIFTKFPMVFGQICHFANTWKAGRLSVAKNKFTGTKVLLIRA